MSKDCRKFLCTFIAINFNHTPGFKPKRTAAGNQIISPGNLCRVASFYPGWSAALTTGIWMPGYNLFT